jgi:putative hydrolase of the HAD superfamily
MPLSAEQVRALWDDLYVPHPHFERRLFVDTLQTLERLRQKGVRLGVVTNRPWTSSVFLPDLSAVGLADYFDVVVSSADVGLRKPHPFIFETALRALDGQPETALMVGDSLANDVGGAEACGMRGIWLRNSDEEGAAAPSHVSVQSISEIFDTGLF